MNSPSRARILLVDGHSMIFSQPDLATRQRAGGSLAREELVRRLRALQDASDWHVAVVFDGRGPKAAQDDEPGGIQIFYSKAGQTADSVIERLTAKYARTHAVTVATDDRMERTTVESLGAETMGSFRLFEEMEKSALEIRQKLHSLKREAARRRA